MWANVPEVKLSELMSVGEEMERGSKRRREIRNEEKEGYG